MIRDGVISGGTIRSRVWFDCSKADLKPGKFARAGPVFHMGVSDFAGKGRGDFHQELPDFRLPTFGYQLDPPVRQIPDKTGDIEPAGNLASRVAETNPLNVARVNHFCALFPFRHASAQ